MHIDGILHFGCTDTVTAYIQHIIDTTGDPVIAIFIPQGSITGEIKIGIGSKIICPATFMITIGGSDDPRPGKFDTKIPADIISGYLLSFFIYQYRLNAGQRKGGMRRFSGCNTCKVGDKDTACFRLPPGIYDRAVFSCRYFHHTNARLLH